MCVDFGGQYHKWTYLIPGIFYITFYFLIFIEEDCVVISLYF